MVTKYINGSGTSLLYMYACTKFYIVHPHGVYLVLKLNEMFECDKNVLYTHTIAIIHERRRSLCDHLFRQFSPTMFLACVCVEE